MARGATVGHSGSHDWLSRDEWLDAVFFALANEARRCLLERLMRGSASVTELAVPFEMTLAAVGKHLRVLERAGLVRREREGRQHRFHLEARALHDAASFLEHLRRS